MRACGVLLGLVLGLAAVGSVCVAVMTADTFRGRLQHHRELRERAHVYAHSQHCRAASRSALGGFHRCDEAERILASPAAWWLATVDVAATLPPMAKSVVDGVRQDLSRVQLTGLAVVCVWIWLRRWTAPAQTALPTWQAQWNAGYTLPVSKPLAYPVHPVQVRGRGRGGGASNRGPHIEYVDY